MHETKGFSQSPKLQQVDAATWILSSGEGVFRCIHAPPWTALFTPKLLIFARYTAQTLTSNWVWRPTLRRESTSTRRCDGPALKTDKQKNRMRKGGQDTSKAYKSTIEVSVTGTTINRLPNKLYCSRIQENEKLLTKKGCMIHSIYKHTGCVVRSV